MFVVSGVAAVLVVTCVVWVVLGVRDVRRAAERADSALRLVRVELDRRYEYASALVLAASEIVGRDLVAPVTGARALAVRVRDENLDLGRQAGAEKALSDALQAVLTSGRRYPQLANDWAFVRPAHELDLIEQRLAGAVRVYNEQARRLDTARRRFPVNLLAGRLDIAAAPLFEATALAVPTSTSDRDRADPVADVAA